MGFSEDIIKRIQEVVDTQFDGVPNRLATMAGVTVQQLGRWLRGETSPQLDKIGPVLDRLNIKVSCPSEDFARPRDVEFINPKIIGAENGAHPPASQDYFAVPLAAEPVAAGPGRIPQDEIRGWVLVWRYHESIRTRSNLVAVTIGKGEMSMTPTLHPGDIVLVDRGEKSPDPAGKIMLVCEPDGGCAIKRVSTRAVDGDIEFVFYSDNSKDFAPKVYRLNRDYGGEASQAIGGRVVWAWSDMTRK